MKLEYSVRIERLAEGDGGGYLAIVPICLAACRTAKRPRRRSGTCRTIASWIEAAREWKQDIPKPSPPLARAG